MLHPAVLKQSSFGVEGLVAVWARDCSRVMTSVVQEVRYSTDLALDDLFSCVEAASPGVSVFCKLFPAVYVDVHGFKVSLLYVFVP